MSGKTLYLLLFVSLTSGISIRLGRDSSSNSISLTCLPEMNDGSRYYRNDTRLPRDFITSSNGGATISFTITPEDEGIFWCEQGAAVSDDKILVAFPRAEAVPSYYIARVQQQLKLPCGMRRGALEGHYEQEWRLENVNTGRFGRAIDAGPGTGYQVDPSDYSLTIEAVGLGDRGDYTCTVFVYDPIPNNYKTNHTETTLAVFVPPHAELSASQPLPLTVSQDEEKTIILTCNVTGYPEVTHTWKRDGNIIDRPEYQINDTTLGLSTVISTLTIPSVEAGDSGEYECSALITMPTSGPYTDSIAVSILSDEFQLCPVVQTIDDKFQFCIHELDPLPQSFRVKLKLTNEVAMEQNQLLTSDLYDQVLMDCELCFEVPVSDFDYEVFRIQAALVVDGVTGPYVPDEAILIDLTTDGHSTDGTHPFKSTWAFFGYSVIGIIIVIIVIVIMTIRIATRCDLNRRLWKVIDDPDRSSEEKTAALGRLGTCGSPEGELEGNVEEGEKSGGDSGPEDAIVDRKQLNRVKADSDEEPPPSAYSEQENVMELVMFTSEPRNLSLPLDPQHGTSEGQSSENPEKTTTDGPT